MRASRTNRRSAWLLTALPLVLVGWIPTAPEENQADAAATTEYRKAIKTTDIRVEPASWVQRFARVNRGGVVEVHADARVEGRGCSAGWLKVVGGGFVCSSHTKPATSGPREEPTLVDGLLPFFYAHRASNKAYSYGFREVRDHELIRPSGKAHASGRYVLHAPSRLVGHDLRHQALPPGTLPAFTHEEGVMAQSPRGTKIPTLRLPKHTALVVELEPGSTGQMETVRIDGEPMVKHIDASDGVRVWVPSPAPEEVGPDEIWIDVDVTEQMLAVRRGEALQYVTLISGGTHERDTPTGTFHIDDKRAYSSMGSGPDSPDQYFVEHVPWTMYFIPSYAIHGAYWHDEFGNRRSHGCINLAPRDARAVYSMVGPDHQPGFFKTWATESNPGAVVRIRESTRNTGE